MARLTGPEKRLYPWRVGLDRVACEGLVGAPHLPVLLRELIQQDPAAAPYEWTCMSCDTAKPSVMWDNTVPVPPHEFVANPHRTHGCRVCWQPEVDRGWHPEATKPVFDPATVAILEPIMTLGSLSVVLDDTLGYMEVYYDESGARLAFSRETWRTMSATDEAWERALDAKQWVGTGMRWLQGVPVFDEAMRVYAESNGGGVVTAKDEITQLYELARSLTLQAASIGATGTDEQRKVLMGRYLHAREGFKALQARLDRLETELDTTALAVIDCG